VGKGNYFRRLKLDWFQRTDNSEASCLAFGMLQMQAYNFSIFLPWDAADELIVDYCQEMY
jgi:hypothetical protein